MSEAQIQDIFPLAVTGTSNENAEWLEPEKITHTLLPVAPLPLDIIPEALRGWIADISYRMQCPPDIAAATAIVMIGSVIGTGCGIRPKQKDHWLVVPNLYGAVVGRPGVLMKSPTLAEILKPLIQLETEAKKALEDKKLSYATELEINKIRSEVIRGKIKDVAKNEAHNSDSKTMDMLKEQYSSLNNVSEPIWRRYRTNNATIEKVSELLNDNPRGLLMFCDELTGLLNSWEKSGHEQDRAFYLEAWNGTGDHYTDRIGRGTTHTVNMYMSIFGGIQPTKLQQYLQSNRFTSDGMLQRFQLLVCPDEQKDWKLIDQLADGEAKSRAFEVVRQLSDMDFPSKSCAMQEVDDKIPYFHFTNEAQEVFNAWLTRLEIDKIRGKEEESILVEHLVKYRKLMPSLALIFHLIAVADGKASGSVSLEAANCAVAWCDYLESHARRVYNLCHSLPMLTAANLARRISKGEVPWKFTVRDIYRNAWSGLTDGDVVQMACDILVEKSWIREVHTIATFQQRSKTEYIINPKVPVGSRIKSTRNA